MSPLSINIGDTVGDYKVLELAGSGGMGAVYKIEHLITKRVEAMKVLPTGIGSDPVEIQRFEREIAVQARLHHPNIAALYNAVRAEHSISLIMEFVEGESLQRILERGKLPVRMAANYAGQILDALDYAHSKGVTHRDVTPANVIITDDGVAKLTDFGLAVGTNDPRLSSAGVAVGSAWYMSPEQVRAEQVDARADIFSAGAVLHEMLTGRKLYDADGTFAVMRAQLETVPANPGAIVPNIPASVDEIVARALAKDKAARFQTAADFRAALDQAVAAMPAPAPEGVPLTPVDPASEEKPVETMPAPAEQITPPEPVVQPEAAAQAESATPEPAPQPKPVIPPEQIVKPQPQPATWYRAGMAPSRAAIALVLAAGAAAGVVCGVVVWRQGARVSASTGVPVPQPAVPKPQPFTEAPAVPAVTTLNDAPEHASAVAAETAPVPKEPPRAAAAPRPAPKGRTTRQPAATLQVTGADTEPPAAAAPPKPAGAVDAAPPPEVKPVAVTPAAAPPVEAAPAAETKGAAEPAPEQADSKPAKSGNRVLRVLGKLNPFHKTPKNEPADPTKKETGTGKQDPKF